MSNLTDLLDQLGYEGEKATNLAGVIAGTVADFAGAIGAIPFAINLIEGLYTEDDSLRQILSAIQAGVSQIQGQIGSSDKLQRMRDVDQGINPAVAVFEQLSAILSASPPVSQDFKLSQIQTCLDAVLFFTDYDDKWLAVQADLPYYQDSWTGKLAPQVRADGLVFNYTYTLPQFIRAIYIFLTAVRALDASSLQSYRNVLNKCLGRLEFVHDTIASSGIVAVRAPVAEEVGSISGPDGIPPWTTDWRSPLDSSSPIYYPYGAVEVYSGVSNVSSYMTDYFNYWGSDLWLWGAQESSNFLTLVQLRTVRKMKSLYEQLGLPAIWQTINRLRRLTEQPLLAGSPYNSWSFQEVLSILDLTLPPSTVRATAWSEPVGLESALSEFLKWTPPYISFWVYGPDPSDPNYDPSHFSVAMLPVPLPSGSLYTFLTGVSLTPTDVAVDVAWA